jgi:hypothetical protein
MWMSDNYPEALSRSLPRPLPLVVLTGTTHKPTLEIVLGDEQEHDHAIPPAWFGGCSARRRLIGPMVVSNVLWGRRLSKKARHAEALAVLGMVTCRRPPLISQPAWQVMQQPVGDTSSSFWLLFPSPLHTVCWQRPANLHGRHTTLAPSCFLRPQRARTGDFRGFLLGDQFFFFALWFRDLG